MAPMRKAIRRDRDGARRTYASLDCAFRLRLHVSSHTVRSVEVAMTHLRTVVAFVALVMTAC